MTDKYKKLLGVISAVALLAPLISFAANSFQVDTDTTLMTGLRAYYQLEEASGDRVEFNGTSTYNLAPTNTPGNAAGKVVSGGAANALDLERTSTQNLSTSSDLGITGGAISMAGWVQVEDAPGTDTYYVPFAQGDTTNNVSYFIYYADESGTKRLIFARTKANVAQQSVNYDTTLTPGTWYHIALTYDSINIRGYVSSTSVVTPTAATSTGTGGGDSNLAFKIGDRTLSGGGTRWDGLIDEVGVWNKALTQTEINDLYNANSGQTMVASVPAAAPARCRIQGVGRCHQ